MLSEYKMAEGWINKMAEGLFTDWMLNNAKSYQTNSKKIIAEITSNLIRSTRFRSGDCSVTSDEPDQSKLSGNMETRCPLYGVMILITISECRSVTTRPGSSTSSWGITRSSSTR